MNAQFARLINQAVQDFQNGHLTQAEDLLNQALRISPRNFDALHILGVIKGSQNKHEEAKNLFKKAVRLEPNNSFAHFNLAKSLSECGQDQAAILHHQKAIELNPGNAEAWLSYGKSLHNLKQEIEALNCFNRSLEIQPDYAEALTNQGISLRLLKRHQESLRSLEKSIAINPAMAQTWSALGATLDELKRFEEALVCYDQAITLDPELAEAHNNRGASLQELKRYDEALISIRRAITINPRYAEAYYNLGLMLVDLNRHEEALLGFEKSLSITPGVSYCYAVRLYTKMLLCDWGNFTFELAEIINQINTSTSQRVSQPGSFLALPSSPFLQQKCAAMYVEDKHRSFSSKEPLSAPARGPKIRLGYFSSDFRDHPVCQLTIGLFEAHDRQRFEVIGFGLTAADTSPLGQQVTKAFDQFVDLSQLSLADALSRVHELGLDIGINLNGYTKDHRTELFSHRVAPIQVNYLGYPGTMGAEFMDYILADKTLIPKSDSPFYTEKIACLPHSFFINSYRRNSDTALPSSPSRLAENLPASGLVFCCFNNNYKITPDVFEIWTRLLKQFEGSVLWFSAQQPKVIQNLRQEAEARGVSADRLVFAERLESKEAHLQRIALADLFLDTFHYNAHTTACDALWAGLPVLTLAGPTFASRVAASLLRAVDLPELITNSPLDYEALAVDLASHPEKLSALKAKLAHNKLSQPLFDTALTTRHIEAAYQQMLALHQQGLPPAPIDVPA